MGKTSCSLLGKARLIVVDDDVAVGPKEGLITIKTTVTDETEDLECYLKRAKY